MPQNILALVDRLLQPVLKNRSPGFYRGIIVEEILTILLIILLLRAFSLSLIIF